MSITITLGKAGAKRFYSLNLNDFRFFHRPGDPEILSPESSMKTHAPIHPGEVLREDFLIPLGLSEYRVRLPNLRRST